MIKTVYGQEVKKDFYSDDFRYTNLKRKATNRVKFFSGLLKGGLTVLFSVFIIFTVARASTSTFTPPSGAPTAQFYTLAEIYELIANNTAATEGGHDFTFSDNLAGSGYTLSEIYNALTGLIDADKVLAGTTYLGTAGALTNNGVFTLTASSSDQSVSAGYYSGGTLSGDEDLAAANIANGVNIFGVVGTLAAGYTYGDTDPAYVLTTAIGAGHWDATNLTVGTVASGTLFGDNLSLTGAYPSDTYPLSGDTGATDAGAGDVLSGLEAWTKAGALLTGTMDNNGTFTLTAGSSDQSVSAGYYSGGTLPGDADLIAANIRADTNIFGVTGTLFIFENPYNGSAATGDYPLEVGGVDDYNANSARPADSYAGSWTDCVAGNNYCDTNTSTADARDDSTGLIWSVKIDGPVDDTPNWFWANNCAYPNGLGDEVCDTHNEAACKCVKLAAPNKTGCEALGDGWRLPYQKELMQVYIDGSWQVPAVLSNAGYNFWSATTVSNFTHYAWDTTLYSGYTYFSNKTNETNYRVRCVR